MIYFLYIRQPHHVSSIINSCVISTSSSILESLIYLESLPALIPKLPVKDWAHIRTKKTKSEELSLTVPASIQHRCVECERKILQDYQFWWDHSFLQDFKVQMNKNDKNDASLSLFSVEKCGIVD